MNIICLSKSTDTWLKEKEIQLKFHLLITQKHEKKKKLTEF